jgi:hypothetical protein
VLALLVWSRPFVLRLSNAIGIIMQVVTTIWTVLAVFFLPQLKLDPTRDYVIVILVTIQGGLSVVLVILMVPSSTCSFHCVR